MIEKIIRLVIGIKSKLPDIIQSIWGCTIATIVFIINFISGFELMICMVVFCSVTDAIWGIAVAVKEGRFVVSELGRNTAVKFAGYGNAMFILIGIDKFIGIDFHITTVVATTVICAAELWSISGNILIIMPNFHFFKLIRPALRGEISRKLGVPIEHVDEILNNRKKKTTPQETE